MSVWEQICLSGKEGSTGLQSVIPVELKTAEAADKESAAASNPPKATPSEAAPNDKKNENGNNGNNGDGGNGNTNNTGGSQNQSGILMPQKPVSDIEQSLIDEIRESGHHKNYELIEYVNDVNRQYTQVLMEVNIDGVMDTAYAYGNERISLERFTGWDGYYTYDPRESVSRVTDREGRL